MFACHRGNYHGFGETFRLGHIDTGFIKEKRALMYEINNLKSMPEKCQVCDPCVREKCHICLASNKEAYGDFHKIRDEYCLLMHELLVEREKNCKNETPVNQCSKC
jgi:hypothetical protein